MKYFEILAKMTSFQNEWATRKQRKNSLLFAFRNIPYSAREWPIKLRLFDHGPSKSLESIWELTVKDERKKKVRNTNDRRFSGLIFVFMERSD